MNDIIFVMANSKLAKKKKIRKYQNFSIEDLESDDEWIVEDDENSDLDVTEGEVDLVNLGKDDHASASHVVDDLEVPDADADEDGDANENEDDDEPDWLIRDLLLN